MHLMTTTANRKYKLTEDDIALAEARARFIANNAHNHNWKSKVPNQRYKESVEAHTIGDCAEIAYAVATGKQLQPIGAGVPDETDFDGIEIRAATWALPNIELKVPLSEYDRKVQVGYVLARVTLKIRQVEFIGSILRQDFDRVRRMKQHKIFNWYVDARQLESGLLVITGGECMLMPFSDTSEFGCGCVPH